MTATLSAGFADPVADAQHCFRAILDAMARPGRVHRIAGPDCPAPLCPAAGAVLLSLIDHETRLTLGSDFAPARAWIAFHTGAPAATGPADSAFVLDRFLPPLEALNAGGHETPEASTTVILQIASLSSGRSYTLTGPGLRGRGSLTADGLPGDFIAWWEANRRMFPRGIDIILCADDQIAGLPRTVSIVATAPSAVGREEA